MEHEQTQEGREPLRGPGHHDETMEEAIRRRAYAISQGEHPGTPEENWSRAEREIRIERSSGQVEDQG